MHDLGDTIPLDFLVTDSEQVPTAATVTLTITQPNGVAVSPVVTATATTGRYRALFVPTQAGRHLLRWTASGGATAARSDVLNVSGASSVALVSLAEARQHLNMHDSETVDDSELRAYIAAATGVIERHLGQVVARRAITESHNVRGASSLALRRSPVLAVTSIATADGAISWDTGRVSIDQATGMIGAAYGPAFSGSLTVTYEAGWVEVPPHILLAALIITAHLWQTQRVPAPGMGVGPSMGSEVALTPSGAGYAIPHRAVELLGGRPPVIA